MRNFSYCSSVRIICRESFLWIKDNCYSCHVSVFFWKSKASWDMTNEAKSSKGISQHMKQIDTVRDNFMEIYLYRFLPINAHFKYTTSKTIHTDFVKTKSMDILWFAVYHSRVWYVHGLTEDTSHATSTSSSSLSPSSSSSSPSSSSSNNLSYVRSTVSSKASSAQCLI